LAEVYDGSALSEISMLGNKILSILSPIHRVLFLKYEQQVNLAHGSQIEKAYQLGLRDAMALPNNLPNRIIK
jgi:hypothetical protein